MISAGDKLNDLIVNVVQQSGQTALPIFGRAAINIIAVKRKMACGDEQETATNYSFKGWPLVSCINNISTSDTVKVYDSAYNVIDDETSDELPLYLELHHVKLCQLESKRVAKTVAFVQLLYQQP